MHHHLMMIDHHIYDHASLDDDDNLSYDDDASLCNDDASSYI